MTDWEPDTCNCLIENYETNRPRFVRRCGLHQTATKDQVLAHNRSFELAKQAEKQRSIEGTT